MSQARHGLRIRTKLLLISLILFTIPWLGYRYLEEMRNFLFSGQEKAQALTAQAIATVLHERRDLFEPVDATPRPLQQGQDFYAYPLHEAMQLDGYASDWDALQPYRRHYGVEATQEQYSTEAHASLSFALLIGVRDQQLHAYVSVRDDIPVYRHPGYRRLDNSDQLRVTFLDEQGNKRRILLLAEGPGHMSAYEVDRDWRHALDGQPLRRVAAFWQPTPAGYDIELRLPLALLGPSTLR